jgi:hypothetical protein
MSSFDNKSSLDPTTRAFGATPLAGNPAATFDFIIVLLDGVTLARTIGFGCTGAAAGGIVTVAFITGGETVGVALLVGLNFPALRSAKRCS